MEDIASAATPDDIAYVRAGYVTFDALARGLRGETDWPGTQMPRATYRTPDGALWFPRDWWRLHDDAGGIAALRPLFERRLVAAATRLGHPPGHVIDPASEWDAYVAGLYGACLRDVTPEAIALKELLVARLDRMLGDPRPDDRRWCEALRADVDALDGVTRPFATCDRIRFGKPTSRDRLITAVRVRLPQVFA